MAVMAELNAPNDGYTAPSMDMLSVMTTERGEA